MKNIKVLDCTLRDGGYIVDSIFGDTTISCIIDKLTNANIDIVEVGFLKNGDYVKGSSTFNNISQIKKFLPTDKKSTSFAAMIDFGRYDIDNLPQNDGENIDAIRNCFFKKDRYRAIEYSYKIQEKGYKLFVQPVDILGYNDKELLELIEITNKIKPLAFSIVDTFGSMYEEDLVRIFSLLNHNLDKDISIGFHSHNNLQLSFALAQKIIQLASNDRNVIIDSTLCGMGRGAGNTNTELIIQYLNKKYNYGYDINTILDLIDLYITPISNKKKWGYSIPYFIAGMYSCHVHNITYLLDKHKIRSKDMQNVISCLDPQIKKRYDYTNLEQIYISYFNNEINDEATLKELKTILQDKVILILAPGLSLRKYENRIKELQNNENLITISVNFYNKNFNSDFLFFSNAMRLDKVYNKYTYDKLKEQNIKIIVTSSIKTAKYDYNVNYNKLINRNYQHFDNAVILLLNLLVNLGFKTVYTAGFDGYILENSNNYIENDLQTNIDNDEKFLINKEIKAMLKELKDKAHNGINIEFITPSIYESEK